MATKRMPTGLVIRDRSIKIWFMYRGKRCWESLPLKPTTANIRHATKLREEVCTRIAIGVFDYAEFFPDSKRAEETEHSTMKMIIENYFRWIDLADKQRKKSKIEQLFDGKCANSVPKNTKIKISIGYLSDILVEAG